MTISFVGKRVYILQFSSKACGKVYTSSREARLLKRVNDLIKKYNHLKMLKNYKNNNFIKIS